MKSFMVKRCIIIFVLFIGQCTGRTCSMKRKLLFNGAEAPSVLTMERAVEIAYQHRPDIKSFRQLEQAYKMEANAVWAGHLPTVDLQTDIQKWRGQNPTTNIGLTAHQLIYSPTLPHDYKAACRDTERQMMVTEQALLDIRHAVEVEFLKGWQLQQQEEAIQSLYTSSEMSFKEAQHKNKLCLLDKTDWLQNTSDHAANLTTFYGYNDDMNIEQRKLEFLLGYGVSLRQCTPSHPALNLSWNSDKEVNLYKLGAYVKSALKLHPALKEIIKRIETEQQRIKSLQKTALPTVSLNAGAGHNVAYSYDVTNHDHSSYNLGVQVNWNIFDGLINDYKEQSEKAKLIQERFNYDYKAQEITSNIETAFYTLSKSMTTLRSQEIELKRAKNEFERHKQELDAGIISKVEYTTAQTTWEKARYQWIATRVDAAIKERDLLYACGYPEASELEIKNIIPVEA